MIILEDTRQQESKHRLKHEHFIEKGIHWNRTALYCGDYTLPADQTTCIDTKKDLQELIGDIHVKKMTKKDVLENVNKVCMNEMIPKSLGDALYHIITDDDDGRFPEKEINDICFKNHITEGAISKFQQLYVKRQGFFHRGLKRAQNSEIKLYILVDNKEGVESIDDLFRWHNPRLDYWTNSMEVIGYWKNGKPKYKKVRKYPNATTGEVLAKACLTMQLKYGCEFQFCKPEESGEKILEILGVNVDG